MAGDGGDDDSDHSNVPSSSSSSEDYYSDSDDTDDSDGDDDGPHFSVPTLPDGMIPTLLTRSEDAQTRELGKYISSLRDSAKQLKKKHFHLQKKKKHHGRSTNKIFYYLMKSVDAFGLPVLYIPMQTPYDDEKLLIISWIDLFLFF